MFIREDIRDDGTLLVFDSSCSVYDLIDLVREVDPSALMACAGGFENAIWIPEEPSHA